MPAPQRGGAFIGRGRGRGRGDWGADRGRGRAPFDDRGDRYPRSRSQEGRWGRERDDRERGDRFLEQDPRRDPRDDRDNRADLFRSKKDTRVATNQQEPLAHGKEVSPPPVAPSAPAFGSVPNRNPSLGDIQNGLTGIGKPPPTAPRAFGERPPLMQELPIAPTGPAKSLVHDPQPIPVGPRAQRPTSKQWISPHLKKAPDSPKMMRAQSFGQPRLGSYRHDGPQGDQVFEHGRPQSSDSKEQSHFADTEDRRRAELSAEPGEITTNTDDDYDARFDANESRHNLPKTENYGSYGPRREAEMAPKVPDEPTKPVRRRIRPCIKTVRFNIPDQQKAQDRAYESEDDDDDMIDYFTTESAKAEAELRKLHTAKVPVEVVERYTALSHAAMVHLLYEKEGLTDMLGEVPEDAAAHSDKTAAQQASDAQLETAPLNEMPIADVDQTTERESDVLQGAADKDEVDTVPTISVPEPEEMEIDTVMDETPPAPTHVQASTEPAVSEEAHPKSISTTSPAPLAIGDASVPESATSTVQEPALISAPNILESTDAGSKLPSTPSQVEDEGDEDDTISDEVASVDVEEDLEKNRLYMSTPPLDDLPDYFINEPWDKDADRLDSLEEEDAMNDFVLRNLREMHLAKSAEQQQVHMEYETNYRKYLDFTMSDDSVATRSREKFALAAPQVESTGTVTPEPRSEGRTGRRFASERDLERVLQASMREEDERREREQRVQQEKFRSDKEATIPNMIWNAEDAMKDQFLDRTGYVPENILASVWQVLPPQDNFSREEVELFEKRYLERPKQWGEVAKMIPNRDFGTCIQYYYLMKKELNLKEKLRKQPKRRKKGRGKQRSSALVSELGNGEQEGEENNDNTENGERSRRPRRAAAPTWGFEQPLVEAENGTPGSTPGRRGASAVGKGEQTEKTDGRKGRRRTVKDKEPKQPKQNQALAAAPASGGARSRSRSDNKGQNTEFQSVAPAEVPRLGASFEPQAPGLQMPFPVQKLLQHQQPLQSLERPLQGLAPTTVADVMSTPSLRPEPPPPPQQPAMTTFNLAQPQQDRKAPTQASSYWSVSETNDFPHLLKAFGQDWAAIAAHMGSKTPVMVGEKYVM